VSGRVAVRDTAERLGLSGRRRAGIVADFAVFDEWGS
jgi:N-acyl-D-aspartate/D-glutamate deacylase